MGVNRVLTQEISLVLTLIEDRQRRHRESQYAQAATERLFFLQRQVTTLHAEIIGVHTMAALLQQYFGDIQTFARWQLQRAQLAEAMPPVLLKPGPALLAGNLALLEAIAHIGASIANVRGERSILFEHLSSKLTGQLFATTMVFDLLNQLQHAVDNPTEEELRWQHFEKLMAQSKYL